MTASDEPTSDSGPALGAPPPGIVIDDAGCVADSLPCRGCGYDLKGLAADSVCPECAAPVARSVHGDLLRYCDPAWLGRLDRGLLLVFLGLVGGVALQIAIMMAAIAVSAIGAATGTATIDMTTVIVAGGLATAIVTLVNVIGAWLLTTQDPGRAETEPALSMRKVARFAIMASLVAAPMQMVMGQSGAFSGGTGAGVNVKLALTAVSMTVALVALVGWVAFYVHMRQMVQRVPHDRFARQLRIILWGYAISTLVSLAFGTVSMVMMATGRMPMTGGMSGGTTWVAIVVGFGSCFSVMAFMAFELWAGILFLFLRKRLTG